MRPNLDAFFQSAGVGRSGRRLYLHHQTEAPPSGAIVFVHAFAESMNKSRRMASLQARALADAGFAVLQIDLLGCGDSSGDFADATWADWLDDVREAASWLRACHPATPLWLWGHREGALLAAEALPQLETPADLLLWQPVLRGAVSLQQFLRLKAAALWAEGGGKGVVENARAQLSQGGAVEVAGYLLSPRLAAGLAAAVLGPPTQTVQSGRLLWLEVDASDSPEMPPAAAAAIDSWRTAGWAVQTEVVQGPRFWQTNEIEDAPALLAATTSLIADATRGAERVECV